MNPAQMKSLLQLVGVTCILYALYNTWMTHSSLEMPLMSGEFARQPFLWIGVALVVGPYVVALFVYVFAYGRTRAQSVVLAGGASSESYCRCRHCAAPITTSAQVCRKCGEFQY